MALIPCPSCGQQVSGRAKACPQCGFGVAEWVATRTEEDSTARPIPPKPESQADSGTRTHKRVDTEAENDSSPPTGAALTAAVGSRRFRRLLIAAFVVVAAGGGLVAALLLFSSDDTDVVAVPTVSSTDKPPATEPPVEFG